MILRLVLAELRHRPGRAAFLLSGYALGVAVMVVLLAVGEAMLEQARDRALVGGGDVVLVPAGISAEMLKAGGATALFLGIDQARFVQRRMLESERARQEYGVRASSPLLDGKLVVLSARGAEWQGLATGEIPSRAGAVGAAPELLSGAWRDSPADQRWIEPSLDQLYEGIDRFHLPTGAAAADSTWAEWHYFNFVLDRDRWLYLTFLVGGRVGTPGEWGGQVLMTIRDADGVHRSLSRDFPDREVRFDTTTPDLSFGGEAFVEQEGGVYRVRAAAGGASVDLLVRPDPTRYFPPASLGGEGLVSGYTVPALYATAEGEVCLPTCEAVAGATAYHDHNWGVWRDVSWEWGAASNESLSLLYGVVRGDSSAADEPLFAYLVDRRGVRGLFRPRDLRVTAWRPEAVGGVPLRVPAALEMEDARRGLRVSIQVEAAHVTDMRRPRRRYFVQMRGVATVEEPGHPTQRLPGFFETYVDGE